MLVADLLVELISVFKVVEMSPKTLDVGGGLLEMLVGEYNDNNRNGDSNTHTL